MPRSLQSLRSQGSPGHKVLRLIRRHTRPPSPLHPPSTSYGTLRLNDSYLSRRLLSTGKQQRLVQVQADRLMVFSRLPHLGQRVPSTVSSSISPTRGPGISRIRAPLPSQLVSRRLTISTRMGMWDGTRSRGRSGRDVSDAIIQRLTTR